MKIRPFLSEQTAQWLVVVALGLFVAGAICNVVVPDALGDRLALLLTAQAVFLILFAILDRIGQANDS